MLMGTVMWFLVVRANTGISRRPQSHAPPHAPAPGNPLQCRGRIVSRGALRALRALLAASGILKMGQRSTQGSILLLKLLDRHSKDLRSYIGFRTPS